VVDARAEQLEWLRSNELHARSFGVLDYAAACQEYAYQFETYGRPPVDERGRVYKLRNELGPEIRIGLGAPQPPKPDAAELFPYEC
jgi:hypothetical protein